MADEKDSAEAPKEPKKKSKKLLLIGLLVGNVAALGGIAAYVILGAKQSSAQAEEAAADKKSDAQKAEKDEAKKSDKEEAKGDESEADEEESADSKPAKDEDGSEEDEKSAESDEEAEASDEGAEAGGGDDAVEGLSPTVAMGSFVINLNEAGSIHYLKVSIRLEVDKNEVSAEVKARDPQLRDLVISYLSSLSLKDTQGLRAKDRIRRDLTKRFNDIIRGGKVHRIYFTEFVVQ